MWYLNCHHSMAKLITYSFRETLKNIFVTSQNPQLILWQEIWFQLDGEITGVSCFGGYFLDSESLCILIDCSFETSIKRAFRKVLLLLYRASIGAWKCQKFTKIRYSYGKQLFKSIMILWGGTWKLDFVVKIISGLLTDMMNYINI